METYLNSVVMTESSADRYGLVFPTETPEFLADALEGFESEIDQLPIESLDCLRQAQDRCPELLTDTFKLMFLRCEVFDTKLAAQRYAHYWEKRIEVCGPDRAFLPLTQEGALKGDLDVLDMGFINFDGSKDIDGRPIIFINPASLDRNRYTRECLGRAVWYVFHAAVENDVNAQRKGVVCVGYPELAEFSQFDPVLTRALMPTIRTAIPVRVTVLHLCHPPFFVSMILPVFSVFMGEALKRRLRIHSGSKEQVLEVLETFGLSKDVLPTLIGGGVVMDTKGWIDNRRAEEGENHGNLQVRY